MNCSKKKKYILPLFILLFIVGCSRSQQAALTAEIQSEAVTRGTVHNSLILVGNVEASQSSELSWKTSGVVDSVSVKVGDKVESGQVLATLLTDSMPASSIAAEADKISAEDDLEELLVSETAKATAYKNLRDAEVALRDAEKLAEGLNYPIADQSEIDAAEKAMIAARDAYQNAVADYEGVKLRDYYDEERMKKYETLQNALTAYAQAYDLWLYYVNNAPEITKKVTAASAKEAQASYEAALKEFKTYQVSFVRKQDQADAEATLEDAVTAYNARSLIADLTGTVTVVNTAAGDYVEKGQSGLRIDDLSTIYISLDISEVDVNDLKDGMKAEITLDAQPTKVYQGTVRYISAFASENDYNVTYRAVVAFEQPDELVKVGMTGEIKIILSEKPDCLLVPSSAIREGDNGSYVEVVVDGTLTPVSVITGVEENGMVEIVSGNLNEGDLVKVPSA